MHSFFSVGNIVLSVNIILTNNHFQYDNMFFQQIMGTICAPPYASIFMHKIENQILNHAPHLIHFWLRFIDDCFFIFTHGEEKPQEVLNYMNDVHRNIKFTFKYTPTTHQHSLRGAWETILQGVKQTHCHLPSLRLQVKPSSGNKNYQLFTHKHVDTGY